MSESSPLVEISAELTPNPNTLKFMLNRILLESGSCNFPDRTNAQKSAMASKLFEVEKVSGVLIGTDFVTVTKMPDAEWPALVPEVVEKIKAFFAGGQPAVSEEFLSSPQAAPQTEIEKEIIEILDREIRPAVARDGGDIIFYGYENGVVKLHLQGSCSSCPSSVMTLKMGIESRLKQSFPDIKEVIQV